MQCQSVICLAKGGQLSQFPHSWDRVDAAEGLTHSLPGQHCQLGNDMHAVQPDYLCWNLKPAQHRATAALPDVDSCQLRAAGRLARQHHGSCVQKHVARPDGARCAIPACRWRMEASRHCWLNWMVAGWAPCTMVGGWVSRRAGDGERAVGSIPAVGRHSWAVGQLASGHGRAGSWAAADTVVWVSAHATVCGVRELYCDVLYCTSGGNGRHIGARNTMPASLIACNRGEGSGSAVCAPPRPPASVAGQASLSQQAAHLRRWALATQVRGMD